MLNKYQEYRRIYPEIRMSYSLYKLWISAGRSADGWAKVWAYLTEQRTETTGPQLLGKETHEFLEKQGPPKEVLEVIGDKHIELERKIEVPVSVAKGLESKIVSVLDVVNDDWVVDYKSGVWRGYEDQIRLYSTVCELAGLPVPNHGMLVQVIPVQDNGQVIAAVVNRMSVYEITDEDREWWKIRLDTMSQNLLYNIEQGELDKYL